MKKYLPGLIFSLAIILTSCAVLVTSKNKISTVLAANTNHVVISEVQTRGSNGANDEFVELFNPTDSAIDLTGWSLKRLATTEGASETNFASPLSGTIPANGYFLVAKSSGYDAGVTADVVYGSSLSDNTTILLYDNSDPQVLVDKVGLGEGTSPEGSPAPQLQQQTPPVDSSVERLVCGEDSDNNANDFALSVSSSPQNSTTIDTDCVTQTASPSPTQSPTESPTATPTATPTSTPTASPTPTISPSSTPTASASPIVKPSHTPKPFPVILCRFEYKTFKFGWFSFQVPFFTCFRS